MERLTVDAPLDWDAPLCDAMVASAEPKRFCVASARASAATHCPRAFLWTTRSRFDTRGREQLIAAERRLAERRGDARAA